MYMYIGVFIRETLDPSTYTPKIKTVDSATIAQFSKARILSVLSLLSSVVPIAE